MLKIIVNILLHSIGLPLTKLGNFLEERVNTFLRQVNADGAEVIIRVVSSSNKFLDTRPGKTKSTKPHPFIKHCRYDGEVFRFS